MEELTIKDIVNFVVKDNEPAKILNGIISMVLDHQNFMVSEASSQLSNQENKREEIYQVIGQYVPVAVPPQEVRKFDPVAFNRNR